MNSLVSKIVPTRFTSVLYPQLKVISKFFYLLSRRFYLIKRLLNFNILLSIHYMLIRKFLTMFY